MNSVGGGTVFGVMTNSQDLHNLEASVMGAFMAVNIICQQYLLECPLSLGIGMIRPHRCVQGYTHLLCMVPLGLFDSLCYF